MDSKWNPDAYFEQMYRDLRERHRQIGVAEHRDARRERLKRALSDALGDYPMSPDMSPRLLEKEDCGDYVRERVEIETLPGMTVPVYVLIPKERPEKASGVLALHGHGYGSRELAGLTPDGKPDPADPGIHRHFAVQLAKAGLVVAAPEVIGFGDRRLEKDLEADPGQSSCQAMATRLLLAGRNLAGLRVREAIRVFDYLTTRDEVDPERCGCTGFSGGGLVAAYAAALEERMKAVLLCGFASTYKGSILDRPHCIDNYVPGLLKEAELPEYIGVIAPRPLFVESGLDDRVFPVEAVREAMASLEQVYRDWGVPDRFQRDLFPGGHEISGRKSRHWLVETLASPREESDQTAERQTKGVVRNKWN